MRFWASILVVVAATLPFAEPQAPQVPGPFPTGAIPTSFTKIIAAVKAGAAGVYRASAPPAQVIVVPKKISYWGNNQYGCCVTTESVFSMAAYSTYVGLDEIFITDATTIAWARAHGDLNGAMLLDVMQDMAKDGIKDEKGVLRKAGKPSSVDFSTEDTLKSALAQGPVSIAIASGSLPSGAGNKSGWSAFGGRQNNRTDHCVSLAGYGPTSELFKALNVSAPANAPANGYLLFTWSTIGIVDHKWLLNTCVEAWVRNPTVTDLAPPPTPPDPPGVITVSLPNVSGPVISPIKFTPTASGGVSPYIFLFEYGDGAQDAAGTHTYQAPGSYTVKVTAVDGKGQLGTATCVAAIGTGPPPPPGPGPLPTGFTITLPQNTPAGMYQLVLPGDLDEIQRRLDAIRGLAPGK